jgi:N-acetylglucosamine-6-phosphate deacetylase
MVLAPTTEIIPLTADAYEVLRIGHTRVTLDTVLAAFADGATAEEIVQQYSPLHKVL